MGNNVNKLLFIVLISSVVAGCSDAGSAKKNINHNKDAEEFCQSIATFSERAMEVRQAGGAMGDILDKVNSLKDERFLEETRALMKNVVRDAYEAPLRSSEIGKKEIISEFKNQVHLECLKAMD